jgi:hypothetical protein
MNIVCRFDLLPHLICIVTKEKGMGCSFLTIAIDATTISQNMMPAKLSTRG